MDKAINGKNIIRQAKEIEEYYAHIQNKSQKPNSHLHKRYHRQAD
jgi:hypothetical protein